MCCQLMTMWVISCSEGNKILAGGYYDYWNSEHNCRLGSPGPPSHSDLKMSISSQTHYLSKNSHCF